jgi:hypothetical protein
MRQLHRAVSDWEFIIKLAVILEASLSEVLVSHLNNESIRIHISGLQMQGRTGRIPLARQAGLLTDEDVGTMGQIADLRNHFAHSPKFIGGSLEGFAMEMSLHERKLFTGKLMGIPSEEVENAFKAGQEWFPSALRFMVWLAAGQVLGRLALRDRQAEDERALQKLREQMLADMQPGPLGLASLYSRSMT